MHEAGPALAFVVARFNEKISDPMIAAAKDEARVHGARAVRVESLTGSYEIPLIANRLASRDDVDAIVALGYIERGETLHGEVMGHVVHAALMQIQMLRSKP